MPAPEPGRAPLAGVRATVSFLTLVPFGRGDDLAPGDLGRSAVYFPLVGAAVGLATAVTAWAVGLLLPAAIAALAAVGAGALLTGALHLDGLADTADGYGGMSRTRALEIMRDHAVGSYGVVAVVLDIGLRAAAIVALLPRPHGLSFLVAAGALSRAAAFGLGSLLPNARAEGGHIAVLQGAGWRRAALAIAVGIVTAGSVVGVPGLLAAIAVGIAAALWGRHCLRRLGGVTGDTLGALSEVSELLVLLLAVALIR